MFLFGLCLFTTFIAEYGGVFGQSYGAASLTPYDFNKDVNNRNLLIKPNENFIYNFEQTRRDQPPQVEQRNENIGRYMHKKPKATTSMPILPSVDNFPRMEPLPHVPTPIVPLDNFNNQWNHVSAYPPTIPPPPSTPKWADLSQILNKQSFPHYETPQQTSTPFHTNQQQYPSVLPAHYQPYVPAPTPVQPSRQVTNFNQEANRQVSHVPSYNPPQGHNIPPTAPQLPPSRGNHKFSWDDVKTENYKATTTLSPPSTTVGHQNRAPPSSFPTLSPWMDGFGK